MPGKFWELVLATPPKAKSSFSSRNAPANPVIFIFVWGYFPIIRLKVYGFQRLLTIMSVCICSCGDPLSPVDSVTISGVPFHHACLLCVVGSPVFLSFLHRLALFGSQVCNKSLEGKMVTLDSENKPYCTKVRGRLFLYHNV